MNKTITIYDLLGLIKDGKAPKKIKWRNEIYYLYDEEDFINYKQADGMGDWLLNQYLWKLNDEVKILDEEDEFIETEEVVSFYGNDTVEKTINSLIHNQKILIEKMKEKKDE